MKIPSLLCSALLLISVPSAVSAYLSPEQVFGGQGTVTPVPPPTPREGEDRVTAQQEESARRREEEQQALRPNYLEPQNTFIPTRTATTSSNPFSDQAQYERRMEKLNEKKAQPTIIISGNGAVTDARGNVLHSGAPLVSQTGPESVLALALLGLAALSTLAYAFVRS